MIAILVEYVGVVLKYAIEKGLDFGTSEFKKRRTVLAKLLVLYNSVHELRIKSLEVIKEFEGYANGTEVATKVVAAKRLQHLLAAFNSFRASSGEVSKALDIYDHELSAMVRGVQGAKMATFWKIVDVTEGVVPKMQEIEGKKTYILAFPTKLPTLDIDDKVDVAIVDKEALEESAKEFEIVLKKGLHLAQVDISDPKALLEILAEGKENVKRLANSEIALREFIKSNFSLDQIFDTGI